MADIDRIYAVFNFEKDNFDFGRLVDVFPFKEKSETSFFTIFQKAADAAKTANIFKEVCLLPAEVLDSESKMRNFITSKYFTEQRKCFVHVISDILPIKSENIDLFISSIEEMMKVLNQVSWFSTRSDFCNYIFEKYNPKFKILVDEENEKKYDNKMLYFTPFASLAWTIFDYSKVDTEDKVKFDQDFIIPMFFIVEYLSRRRSFQPAFMNCYPTIEEERWVFDTSPMFAKPPDQQKDKFSSEIYAKENELFKQKNVDFAPMGQIEKVFEMVCATLGINPLAIKNEENTNDKV